MSIQNELGSFYEQYKDYHQDIDFHEANYIKNGFIHLHWILQQKPTTILELGAGSGIGCLILKKLRQKCRVIASDIDSSICDSIKHTAEKSEVDIEVMNFDMMNIPFPDQSIDVCFSVGVVEHLESIEKIIGAIKEQLRVARIVVIIVPLLHWYITGLTIHGDEFYMPKNSWIHLFDTVGCLLDFVCNGSPSEELVMTAVLTNSGEGSLRLTKDFHLAGYKRDG